MSINANHNQYEVGKETLDTKRKHEESEKSINYILIKPTVKIEISVEELETECSPTITKQ